MKSFTEETARNLFLKASFMSKKSLNLFHKKSNHLAQCEIP